MGGNTNKTLEIAGSIKIITGNAKNTNALPTFEKWAFPTIIFQKFFRFFKIFIFFRKLAKKKKKFIKNWQGKLFELF